jgi:hypothetical protein
MTSWKYGRKGFLLVRHDFEPEKFGQLITIGPEFLLPRSNQTQKRRPYQVCECQCGVIKVYEKSCLGKRTVSCGCHKAELLREATIIHGLTGTSEHNIWCSMKQRCINKNAERHGDYGGRGIRVCDRWLEPNGLGFINFLADMGPKPDPSYTIERKNNDGDYCPENCKWATRQEQANNKRCTLRFSVNGEIDTLKNWCKKFGIEYKLAHARITQKGWDAERAITTPARKFTRKPKSNE